MSSLESPSRRHAGQHALASLALVALAVPAAAAAAEARAPHLPTGGIEAVAAVLRHQGVTDQRTEDDLVEELVDLGPEQVATLFAVCIGEDLGALLDSADDTDWQASPDRLPLLARRALWGLPAEDVLAHLETETGPRSELEVRLDALRVVAGLRAPEALGLVMRIAEEAGPLALRYRSVKKPLVEALAATLAAGDDGWRTLKKEVDEHAPAVLRVVLEAVRAADRPEGMDVLAELLGYVPELDPDVVTAIGDLHDRYPWLVPQDGRELVRPLLYSRDAEVRRAAVCALAKMGDHESFEYLAELLSDGDARVRWAAQQALQTLSDTRLPAEVGSWLAWYEAQISWWNARADQLADQVTDPDVGRALSAVRELSGRPLFRHEAAEILAGSLWSQRPEIAVASCLALEKMGSRRAVPGLADRLFGREEERVQTATLRALKALTGVDLPPDPSTWEEYVNGDGPVPTPRHEQS